MRVSVAYKPVGLAMIHPLPFCAELILHPFTPLYMVAKLISYHSYMVAMKFKESYPRYDRKTPEYFRKILDEFAQSELHSGDSYDEETNVLKQRQARLQENLAAISERDLQNPHIKFFAERNPGHKEVFIFQSSIVYLDLKMLQASLDVMYDQNSKANI